MLSYIPYKVHYLTNEKTKGIYVFYGNSKNRNLSEDELYKECFTEKELEKVKEENIPVFFLESQIHRDDTISTIKIKILSELSGSDTLFQKKKFSLAEIYLFSQVNERFSTTEVYDSLTRNKKIEITRNRLETFLSNINDLKHDDNGKTILDENKEIYTYNDLLSLKFDQKVWPTDKILGQKYFLVGGEYPFVHNPYNVKENYDFLYEKSTRQSIINLNQYLLFQTGFEIKNNSLYLCLAEDVMENAERKGFSTEITSKIYFPSLYSRNIRSTELLFQKKQELVEENKKLLNRVTFESFQVVDMFYNVYQERKSEFPYLNRGIRSLKATIRSDYQVKMPLDVIFKLIHATEVNPLVKFHPGSRQENIYRLFTNQLSKDGQKIPFLSKSTIFKLMKTIGKTKSVAVYLEREIELNGGKPFSFICEFTEKGDIILLCEFENAIPEEQIDELLRESVNPLLDQIRDFLQQNGYSLPPFTSLYDERVEIQYLNYEIQIEIEKEIKWDKLTCLSAVFIQELSDQQRKKKKGLSSRKETEKQTQMRYKRVSNFNKTTSQEAFIIEKINAGSTREEVVLGLIENYGTDLNENDAKELLARTVGQLQVEKGKKKTDIRIKNNPGFKTLFSINTTNGILTVTVENINDIRYLTTIPLFIDSIIRITQDISSTDYPKRSIDRFCSLRVIKEQERPQQKEKEIHIPNLVIKDSDRPLISEPEQEIDILNVEKEQEQEKDQEIGKQQIQNAMDLFFGNDDEEESEGEGEEGDENMAGGNDENTYNGVDVPSELELDDDDIIERDKPITIRGTLQTYKNSIRNIDGMPLNNPYFFQERIEKRDPTLILTKDTGKYNSYSRVCPSNTKRQPVILNNEELKKIERENPGFLRKEDIITYGSDPNKKFHYICPRYWCLKTNTVLDPKDFVKKIENGKEVLVHPTCGKILPSNAKKVIPGHYVYEFYQPKGKGNEKEGEKRYPGFQVDKHPDGYCLPCCFNNWHTSQRLKASAKCEGKDEGDLKEEKEDEYIKGMEKFPLSTGRWGYLPIVIQQFLGISGQVCKPNSGIPCFLRHGVEINAKQSFIACIADAYYYGTSKKIPSVREFKRMIMENLSLDHFVNLQNGNLVNDFYLADMSNEKIEAFINSSRSVNSRLYSLVSSSPSSSKKEASVYYQKVINAFLNFLDFLNDDTIVIDHTYLWDLVTHPKSFLTDSEPSESSVFSFGFNLIILYLPDNDITQNVEILCPTNHYLSEPFNPNLPTLILLKKEDFYEPIYSYSMGTKQSISVVRFFELNTKYENIRKVLSDILFPLIDRICRPLPSLPNRYSFKEAILLSDLEKRLLTLNYKIQKYVLNFNNKVIGVLVKNTNTNTRENNEVFVPSYPSSLSDLNKEAVFMTDPTLWKSYEKTIQMLNELKEKSEGQIPCQPMLNVIEDKLIVGILTETNQFIQINPPLSSVEVPKGILLKHSIKGNNTLIADVKTSGLKEEDTERVDMIQKIRKETQFYNVFRNTIRILLNDYEKIKERENLEEIINQEFLLYGTKLKKIQDLLKRLVGDNVLFVGDENYYRFIDEISTCLVKDKKQCSSSNVCAVVKNENSSICQLILPRKNLITQKENEPIYYGRMADEFIRYTRIQDFMFQPEKYLSFGNNQVKYNLRENEMLLVQSMITQEYFQKLVPVTKNPYVKNNSYDEVEPLIHPLYENGVSKGTLSTILTIKPKSISKTPLNRTIVLEQDEDSDLLEIREISEQIQDEPEQAEVEEEPEQAEEPEVEQAEQPEVEEVEQADEEEEPEVEEAPEQAEEPEVEEEPEQVKEQTLEKDDKMNLSNSCKEEVETPIFDKKRNQLFPTNYKEFKYKNNDINCSYDIIMILTSVFQKPKTIPQIREDLWESYQPYLSSQPSSQVKIIDILKKEGKETLGNQVLNGSLTFEDMIMSEAYFLSFFDLWLLVQKYQLPTVFMGTYKLLETNFMYKIMVGYKEVEKTMDTTESFFIVTQPFTKKTPMNKPPINRLILTNTNQLLIPFDTLNKNSDLYKELKFSWENTKTVEDFLNR